MVTLERDILTEKQHSLSENRESIQMMDNKKSFV